VPDKDGDSIADYFDLCDSTPAGANVWKEGDFIGCSDGENRDI
jgi:hypothetical protein